MSISQDDLRLATALVHDAAALTHGTKEEERQMIRERLVVAELLLKGQASAEERTAAFDLLHPLTLALYQEGRL